MFRASLLVAIVFVVPTIAFGQKKLIESPLPTGYFSAPSSSDKDTLLERFGGDGPHSRQIEIDYFPGASGKVSLQLVESEDTADSWELLLNNQSKKLAMFRSFESRLYIARQIKFKGGDWFTLDRAPGANARCGNSFYDVGLVPGETWSFPVDICRSAEFEFEVRYRLLEDWGNTGKWSLKSKPIDSNAVRTTTNQETYKYLRMREEEERKPKLAY